MTTTNGTSSGSANGNGSASRKTLRVAVIPGDGIGQEVMPEGLACLRAAAKRYVCIHSYR